MSAVEEVPRRKIRVLFPHAPPQVFDNCRQFPTLERSTECPFPGWTTEIVSMCAEYAKFEVVPVVMDDIGEDRDLDWGLYSNGTWSGVLGLLAEGQIDTVCSLFRYSNERAHSFSFSLPVVSVQEIYITKPKRKSLAMSLWNTFDPYDWATWLLLLMALVAHSGLATLIERLEFNFSLRPKFDVCDKFWQYLRLQTQQHLYFDRLSPFFKLRSGKLAFILYALIQATLFTHLYTAVILSALIQQQNPKPWENFREMVTLIKAKEYGIVMDKHEFAKGLHSFANRAWSSNVTSVRNLRDATHNNPVIVVPTIANALDHVEQGAFIYYTQQNNMGYFYAKKRCNLYYFVDDEVQAPMFFLFGANSSLLHSWNDALRKNQHFIRKTFEKYFHMGYQPGKIPICPDSDYDIREAARPLDLSSTFGIFMIATTGLMFASMVFLLELYIHQKATHLLRRRRNNSTGSNHSESS